AQFVLRVLRRINEIAGSSKVRRNPRDSGFGHTRHGSQLRIRAPSIVGLECLQNGKPPRQNTDAGSTTVRVGAVLDLVHVGPVSRKWNYRPPWQDELAMRRIFKRSKYSLTPDYKRICLVDPATALLIARFTSRPGARPTPLRPADRRHSRWHLRENG